MVIEEKLEKVEVKDNNDSKIFYTKVITASLAVISWLVYVSLRSSTSVTTRPILIISIILSAVYLIAQFGKKINSAFTKEDKTDKIPEPLGEEALYEILTKVVKKMWNYIEPGVTIKQRAHNINKNLIYEYHIKLYSPEDFEGRVTDQIIVLINATYPKVQPVILSHDSKEIRDSINKCSLNPLQDPDTEEITMENELTGNRQRILRKTHKKRRVEQKREDSVV